MDQEQKGRVFKQDKLKDFMFGALYELGNPKQQESLLKAWELNEQELPALFDQTTQKWSFQSIETSKNYTSKTEQNELEVEPCPVDIMKLFSDRKRMYFILSNQWGMILPTPECTPKKFMWQCVIGLKKYMTLNEDGKGTIYKEHKPGFKIKENSIKYWCSYLDRFPGWQKYIPDSYIPKIEKQVSIPKIEDREYIAFDSKYLLSVFNSIDTEKYKEVLRIMFQKREQRLKRKAQNPPLMIQTHFVKKLREMYYGDDKVSILPINVKPCRQKNMTNQLPKKKKDVLQMKKYIKDASNFVHEYLQKDKIGYNNIQQDLQSLFEAKEIQIDEEEDYQIPQTHQQDLEGKKTVKKLQF